MTYLGSTLLSLTKSGLAPTTLEETDHYRLMRDFICDPKDFIETALGE